MSKSLKVGLLVVGLVVVGVIAIWGRNYYNTTYVGRDYYIRVPSSQSTEIEAWLSGDTEEVRGHRYKLMAWNEDGEARIVEFDIMDNLEEITSEAQLLQPNEFLRIHASEERVISWERIAETDVPEVTLKYILESHE